MSSAGMPNESLVEALHSTYPELAAMRVAGGEDVYLVGGAVRDLLLGRGRADIDVVVRGDPAELLSRLGAEPVAEHERFATAKVDLDGHRVDVAAARTETYPRPGALPVVTPAPGIEADLARRDFTINAMAIPLAGEPVLIDPHGGRADLERGELRILHPGSFVDDPTRAIRAARYASRFGFDPEPATLELLRASELDTVSAERRRAELERLGGEATAPQGLGLLVDWGLMEPREDGLELAARVAELLARAPWSEVAGRAPALLSAAFGPLGGERELAAANPQRPSQAVELAGAHDPVELVLARAMGAAWLDDYLSEWRSVRLEIDGSDLIAAGVPQGPALGRGLRAALRRRLDGEIAGRDEELEAALEAARSQ
jgi:tRNA nucleotidyltransferase (CCA-adding enzyme)